MTLRSKLRDGVKFWLDVLQTRNVSRDVNVDADFAITFGGEKLSQLKGSTLVCAVLSIRTACFEIYCTEQNGGIRFFILDTPRQQDLQRESLELYIQALRGLAPKLDFQIVFSTTEYHYLPVEGDLEWTPEFPGGEQKMFLRKVEASPRPPGAQSL